MVEGQFLVTWSGVDGSFNETEKSCLEEAQAFAVEMSELGAHTITISDDQGTDYDY